MAKELSLLDRINLALETAQDSGHRWHLGASIIGRDCARAIWYTHRWVRKERFDGRMLRLFDRGHREEERIIGWLRGAGVTVESEDEGGQQFRVVTHGGHFGGSMDSLLANLPIKKLKGLTVLGEYKTHNAKSFANVSALGCRKAKPEHYTQQQVYMHHKGLLFSIYIAVCKDDDELYIELIEYDREHAEAADARALSILTTDQPPLRIDSNPAFWKCKMCVFKPVCHGTETPEVNCRTCAHAGLGPDGTWLCVRHKYIFTKEYEESGHGGEEARVKAGIVRMKDGCPDHVFNPYMLNGVEFQGGNEAENYATLKLPDGRIVNNGPNHTPSRELCLSLPVTISKKR